MMPSARAFTGFTSTGDNTTDSTQFNVVGSFSQGWKFKRNSADAQGNFFPASGYRAYTSVALASMGSDGYYWSYGSYSQASARTLSFNSGYVHPLGYNRRSYGFSVRPCREFA